MAKFRSQINRVNFALEKTKKPKYPVLGFAFILERGEGDPQEVLAPLPGMPRVAGFPYEFEGVLYGEPNYIDIEVIENARLLEE